MVASWIKKRENAFIIGLLALVTSSLLANAHGGVPKNVERELKKQLRGKNYVVVTIALDVPFDPNPENLSPQELSDQVANMEAVVRTFIGAMIDSGRFDQDDFRVFDGSMAPLLTARVTKKNYRYLLSDDLVLYYAPLTRK